MNSWTALQRNALIASFLSWTFDAFDFFLLIFLLSDIAEAFHAGLEKVTLAILATLVVRPVGALLFGRAAERFGRKPVLIGNIALFSTLELLSAAAPSLGTFLALRVMYGVAMGGIWGVASSLAMETVPERSRGVVSGVFQAGYPLGYLLAAVAYGTLLPSLGWRGLFAVGVAPLALIPFIWMRVAESPVWRASGGKRSERSPFLRVVKENCALCVFLVILMAAFNFFSHGTQDIYPTFLKLQHGFGPEKVSLIAVAYNVASILGGIVFGAISQHIGRRGAMIVAALLSLPVLPLWAFSSGAWGLGIGAFVMQFMVQGAWGVIPGYLNELAPSNARAVLPGFVYQLGNLIASVNATLQVRIASHHNNNYGFAMATVAGSTAVVIAILAIVGRETRGVRISAETGA